MSSFGGSGWSLPGADSAAAACCGRCFPSAVRRCGPSGLAVLGVRRLLFQYLAHLPEPVRGRTGRRGGLLAISAEVVDFRRRVSWARRRCLQWSAGASRSRWAALFGGASSGAIGGRYFPAQLCTGSLMLWLASVSLSRVRAASGFALGTAHLALASSWGGSHRHGIIGVPRFGNGFGRHRIATGSVREHPSHAGSSEQVSGRWLRIVFRNLLVSTEKARLSRRLRAPLRADPSVPCAGSERLDLRVVLSAGCH